MGHRGVDHRRDELGLGPVDLGRCPRPVRRKNSAQSNAGVRREIGGTGQVIHRVRVALLRQGHGGAGQRALEREHGRGAARGGGRVIARKPEHAGDVACPGRGQYAREAESVLV